MKNNRLIHARTCVYNVNYHLVWSVKYRRKILMEGVDDYLKEVFYDISKNKEFIIQAMEIMPDHVHIFVSAHPKHSPSYIVKMLKGISGRKLFLKFPFITKKLWKGKLWNSSYYIETIGSISEENIKRYIETQKERI